MPVSKLMKTQSKGLGDTGKAEIDDYKEAIRGIQQKSYLRIINLHNKLMCKSKYGEVIPMRVRFNPYDTPSELEIAELSEKMSIALLHYASRIYPSRLPWNWAITGICPIRTPTAKKT